MENKSDFFKPTIHKLIIPLVLVIFVLSVFLASQALGVRIKDYQSNLLELKNYAEGKELSGNVISLNDVKFKTEKMNKELLAKIEENKPLFDFITYSNSILNKINPLYPSECAFSLASSCRNYGSEANYISAKVFLDTDQKIDSSQLPDLINEAKTNYKKFSIFFFIINLLIFFIIGYLISCVISFVRKRK